MKRVIMSPRPNWEEIARRNAFTFHHVNGALYWDEGAHWQFTLSEVENAIEDPSAELYAMCLALVDEAAGSQELMERLAIPPLARDAVARSWRQGEPSLYGRFDLAYDGTGPAKLLEFNGDTPTSVYETAYFQWLWLEDLVAAGRLPKGSDQFNRLHEALCERYTAIVTPGSVMHFASVTESVEDRSTVRYLEDLAEQARIVPRFVAIDQIGIDAEGRFVDQDDMVIGALFKLFPWEDLMRSAWAQQIAASQTRFVEPAWKAILSNKAMLPLLWERHRGHPNLLPAAFLGTLDADAIMAKPHARKPYFSREGADIALFDGKQAHRGPEQGYGAEGHIVQGYAPLAQADGNYAVIGSWIVGDACVAMSVREDTGPITRDLARFVPHVIRD